MRCAIGSRLRFRVGLLTACCCFALGAFAQPPLISHITPLAIRPGLTNELTLYGDHLDGVNLVWISATNSFAKVFSSKPHEARLNIWAESVKDPVLGIYIANTNGISNLQLIGVDNLPLSTNATAQLPGALEGVVKESASDSWQFQAARGESVAIEILANRIGSALDPIVRLISPAGKELAFGPDIPSVTSDSAFACIAPEDGAYKVEVRDVGYQGGPKYFYHLRLFKKGTGAQFLGIRVPDDDLSRESEPNDNAASATRIEIPSRFAGGFSKPDDVDYFRFTVSKDECLVFFGKTRSIGSPCDLALSILDTNLQKVASSAPAPDVDGALTNTFKSAGSYFLRVQELAGRGGQNYFYEMDVHPFTRGFQLIAESNRMELNTNTAVEVKVTARRFDFDGPIKISIVPGNSEILLENETIPAKKNETTLKLKLAPERRQEINPQVSESLTDYEGKGSRHQSSGNISEARIFSVALEGSSVQDDPNLTARAKVLASLHKQFPLLLYSPESLEHSIICFVK